MNNITESQVSKFLSLLNHGLVGGLGIQEPGKMCIEAAWCAALELPHGDDPGCVSEPLRRLKIRLNDSAWSTPMARASGLKRLGVAQIGSKGALDDTEFTKRIVTLAIQVYVPMALRAAAGMKGNAAHKDALESAAAACENEPTRAHAVQAREISLTVRNAAAYAYAAADAAADAAAYAADAVADAAADAADAAAYAADAADAAAYAADAAADAAAAAAVAVAVAAAVAAAIDKILSDYAERIVQILIEMKAPGCQWLYLTL